MTKGGEVVKKQKSREGKTYAQIMEEENPELVKKEEPKEEKKEGESTEPAVTENQRLYVMNLSYQVTHDELKD